MSKGEIEVIDQRTDAPVDKAPGCRPGGAARGDGSGIMTYVSPG